MGTKPDREAAGSRHPPSLGIPKVGDRGLRIVPVPILLSHCRVLTGGSSGYHPKPPQRDNPAPASSHPLDPMSILTSHHGKPQREVAQEVPERWHWELLVNKGKCVN